MAFFPLYSLIFLINKKSIAAYAEGKTLGPSGASHVFGAIIMHNIIRRFFYWVML